MKTQPIDLSRVSTYPIAERRNKVSLARDFAGRISSGMSVSDLLAALPNQLGGESLNAVIDAVIRARRNDRPVVIAIGGHVIKCGLQPVLKELIQAGAITAVAMNGSATIHDYELSLIGETSEDVGAVLHCGTFGMAEETGRDINRALREGVADGLGYGEAVGRFIVNLGTGEDATIRELAETVKKVVDYKGKLVFDSSRPDGTPRKQEDISNMHRMGWRHTVELEEGITKTYTWYKENYLKDNQ